MARASLAALASGFLLVAQDSERKLPEMITDRPDYTDSTVIVPRGVFQFESGFTYGREKGSRSVTAPEMMVRFGLAKWLEVRYGSDGFSAEFAEHGDHQLGVGDGQVSGKIKLFEETRRRPSIALIPIVSLPSGSTPFSSNGFEPTLKFAWSKDLIRGFSLGGNLVGSSLCDPDGRYAQGIVSFSLGHDLMKRFGGYWEVFRVSPWEKRGEAAWIGDTGVSRPIGSNAQFDVRVGKRITNSGPDWFFGAGFAFRQPLIGGYKN